MSVTPKALEPVERAARALRSTGKAFTVAESREIAALVLDALEAMRPEGDALEQLQAEVERLRDGLEQWLEAVGPEQVIRARRKASALLQPKKQEPQP